MNKTRTGGNILVVDDDPVSLQLVSRTLAQAGFVITLASDGEQALDKLVTGQVDAVVSDVLMPGVSGIDLLRAIRARFPWLPVILMTSGIKDSIREAASTWGATALFQKPVNRTELILAIQTLPQESSDQDREFFPRAEAAVCP